MKKIFVVFCLILAISAWLTEGHSQGFLRSIQERQAKLPHVEELLVDQDGAEHKVLVATAQEKEGMNMMVVDYDKSLTALYRATDDKCFIIGGIDAEVDFKEQLSHPYEVDYRLQYKVADDLPVTDKSLIPEAMQDICADKETKWLERSIDAVKQARRTKRTVVRAACWGICICAWC